MECWWIRWGGEGGELGDGAFGDGGGCLWWIGGNAWWKCGKGVGALAGLEQRVMAALVARWLELLVDTMGVVKVGSWEMAQRRWRGCLKLPDGIPGGNAGKGVGALAGLG